MVHARAGRRSAAGRAAATTGVRCACVRSRKLRSSVPPVLGGDRLGVELHAPQRARPVLEPHHDLVGRPRRHAQGRRHRADGQRVVAHGREALRDAGEQAAPVVMDLAEPPVHDRRARGRSRRRRRGRAPGGRGRRRAPAPRRAASTSSETPTSRPRSGRPGPGEITMLSTASAATSSHDSSSLRTTIGSSPLTSPSRWKRLKVNES